MSYYSMTIIDKYRKRNLSFNIRHRKYGDEAIMYDFDAVLFHQKTNEVVGYLETKFGCSATTNLNDKEFNCLRTAVVEGKPFFCLWYYTYCKGVRLEANDNALDSDYAQYVII